MRPFSKLFFLSFLTGIVYFLVSCSSSSASKIIDENKRNLLSIDKPWVDKTEKEKIVGCWVADPEGLKGTGNPRTLKGDLNYQMIFYADGSMDEVTFYTVGFSKTDPLIYHNTNYTIENGYLSYTYNGKNVTHPISIAQDQIEFLGRTYRKGTCNE